MKGPGQEADWLPATPPALLPLLLLLLPLLLLLLPLLLLLLLLP
jgi:hypothetical protein